MPVPSACLSFSGVTAAWRYREPREMWLASVLGYGRPHRQGGDNPRAATWRTVDLEGAVERVDAVEEATQTCAARRIGAADPVVGDLEHETFACPARAYVHR